MKKIVALALCLCIAFAFTACGGDSGSSEEKTEITFADVGWDSIKINNAMAGLVAEHVFGYTWQETPGSTPISHEALLKGEIDVHMEEWTNNIENYAKDLKDGKFVELGVNYDDNHQGFYIPKYIADKYPDWQLVIYGEGPLRAQLEAVVSGFKLQERVLLPGRTEKVIDELRKSKIFCLSSDYEGMSNSMIEAICVGLPVVSTKVSGTDELIQDGVNGLLVSIGDEQGMTNALEKLIQDEELMKKMGEENLKKASLFQIDTIVNEWMKLINRVRNVS